jgi:hypothetical protein
MKRFSLLRIGALIGLGLAALNPALKADEYDRKTIISISQPLEVPGVVLAPGTYVMKLFNSSNTRHIVQIMNEDQNQQLALTFAVSAQRVRPTGKTVLTMYEGSRGEPSALRTWFYPGDTIGQEFLYPHGQALHISARTKVAVPEIEAATATPATVTAAAVEAAPVQNETRSEPLIAQAEPITQPVREPEPQPVAEPQAPPAAIAQSEPKEVTSADREVAAADQPASTSTSLPQTAGEGPLAALMGSVAIALAYGMRKLKRNRT